MVSVTTLSYARSRLFKSQIRYRNKLYRHVWAECSARLSRLHRACRAVSSRLTWSARCWEEVNRGSEAMDGRVGGDDAKVMWEETRCASRRFRFPFSVVVSI